MAAFGCASLGMPLKVLRGTDVPSSVTEREALVRLWEREAALGNAALLLDGEAENARPALTFLGGAGVLVATGEALHLRHRRVVRVDVDQPRWSNAGCGRRRSAFSRHASTAVSRGSCRSST